MRGDGLRLCSLVLCRTRGELVRMPCLGESSGGYNLWRRNVMIVSCIRDEVFFRRLAIISIEEKAETFQKLENSKHV